MGNGSFRWKKVVEGLGFQALHRVRYLGGCCRVSVTDGTTIYIDRAVKVAALAKVKTEAGEDFL